ncbi:hypothetical protein OG203_30930 [Nocardia sp. NBC_01499]|uniref:hypothetical protein n=1 Tax=Nocardia sp. NBC_01499 TaxID=2903597 RepID=UPI00387006CE
MKDTKSHDPDGAVKIGAKLSGNAYISVQQRDDRREIGKLLVKQPSACNHGVTICRDCAYSWEWDYVVHYDRTSAGRALRTEIGSTTTDSEKVT